MTDKIKIYSKLCFLWVAYTSASCQSKELTINHKNDCYQEALNSIKTTKLYSQVFTKFEDTLSYIRKDHNFFNEAVEDIKIDEALFLKQDSLERLLVVLERDKKALLFGQARTFYGEKDKTGWKFRVGMEYGFDKDYFQLYPTNDFEKISKLARYSILTAGRQPRYCAIDEQYWFVELLRD